MMSSHRRRAIAFAVVVVTGLAPAVPTRAALPPPGPPTGATRPLKGAAPATLSAARARLRTLETNLAGAQRAEAAARERVAALELQASVLAERLRQLSAEEQLLARELKEARERLRKLAVATYVNGGSTTTVDYLLRAKSPADLSRRRQLVTSVGAVRNQAVEDYTVARDAASAALERVVAEFERVNAEGVASRNDLLAAAGQIGQLGPELDAAREELRMLLAVTPVGDTGIPGLFLDAYRAAADQMTTLAPGCGIRWTAIAGVGRIESNHGRFGDARLSVRGDIWPRIIGIPLDGTNNTALVPDTDGGVLDGDLFFDRAVGPLQVIPSTWQVVARDGNQDAIEDPNNAFDAALTAAVYLCRAAPNGLRGDPELQAAFFSYNHSEAYSLTALHWSKVYDGMRPPKGPIVAVR
jgi:membrane-bound lytic murein transglycosylase B